jgi:hypothetical protein
MSSVIDMSSLVTSTFLWHYNAHLFALTFHSQSLINYKYGSQEPQALSSVNDRHRGETTSANCTTDNTDKNEVCINILNN